MAIEMIGLEITNRCNYACIHCLRADIAPRKDLPPELQNAIGPTNPRLDLSLEIVKKLIEEARPFNVPQVSFTGGEPTIHPDFAEMVRMFYEAGYQFGMVTNGTRFEKTFEIVKPYQDKLFGFCFSMDGATEQTMDFIREKNSFRKSMQAISVCKVKNLPFAIQMVITSSNRHEVEAMAALGSRLGARQVYFVPVQPTLQTTHKGLNLPPEDWYEIKDEIRDLQKTYKVSIEPFVGFPNDDTPWVKCNALTMRALYVDYRGNLTFCCQLSEYADSQVSTDIIGNLAEVSLFDAHTKYVEMINEYHKEKLRRHNNGELTKLDAFACWYCSKYFKKVDFMKKFPGDPWYEESGFSDSPNNEEAIPNNGTVGDQIIPVEAINRS